MVKEDIVACIEKLSELTFDFSGLTLIYNPLEEFVKKVPEKEIIHSKILADLLNKDGSHGLGIIFINSFLETFLDINPSNISDVWVRRERPVKRQVTVGDNRSIDILIEYKGSNRKRGAIIIENKINTPAYQPKQLEDYYRAIKIEGFEDVSVICFHQKSKGSDKKLYICENVQPLILYPFDLAKWIEDSLKLHSANCCHSLYSYVNLLKNLNHDNVMISNIKLSLNIDQETLIKVKAISDTYNKLDEERFNLITTTLGQHRPNLQFDKLGNYLQIKDAEIWEKYRAMLVVSKIESGKNFLSIIREDNDIVEEELISLVKYNRDKSDRTGNWPAYGFRWYEAIEESHREFDYPENDGFNRLINEINRILDIIYSKL